MLNFAIEGVGKEGGDEIREIDAPDTVRATLRPDTSRGVCPI